MVDRKIISRKFYREEAIRLGYKIPANEEETILKEAEQSSKIAAAAAPPHFDATGITRCGYGLRCNDLTL